MKTYATVLHQVRPMHCKLTLNILMFANLQVGWNSCVVDARVVFDTIIMVIVCIAGYCDCQQSSWVEELQHTSTVQVDRPGWLGSISQCENNYMVAFLLLHEHCCLTSFVC